MTSSTPLAIVLSIVSLKQVFDFIDHGGDYPISPRDPLSHNKSRLSSWWGFDDAFHPMQTALYISVYHTT